VNDAYKERLTTAILEALMTTGMTQQDGGQRVAVLPAEQIIDVMTTTMAVLMRDSEATASPSRCRAFCNEVARKLQRRIGEAKKVPSPFDTVLQPGSMQ
jgi:hypothetical protein